VVGLSGYADALTSRVYACRTATEIVQLLHWHDREEIRVDQVLTALLEQPDRTAADVSAGLRAMECAECASVGNRFDERIGLVWPPDRLPELMRALY
jgi:hypothetical protein